LGIGTIISLATTLLRLLSTLAGWARDAKLRESGRTESENEALIETLKAEREAHAVEVEELSRTIPYDDDGFPADDGFRRD
jgi:hypothetical protein